MAILLIAYFALLIFKPWEGLWFTSALFAALLVIYFAGGWGNLGALVGALL